MAEDQERSDDNRSGGLAGVTRDHVIAGGLLLVICAVLLLPALRSGTVLAPVDLYYETPLYAPLRPAGYEEPANPHLFDQAYQFVPWRHYAWQRMRDGDLPLWNPLSAAGTPFVATLQAAVFYPVNLLTLPLPFAATFVASALLRLWIAGFATYLLLRRYGSSVVAGLLGGTAFMLSGFVVGWLGHPHTNVAIWLPALILCVEGLRTSKTRQAALRWWAALALVTGVQFLGGHIETSRDILLAAGLYAVIRTVQNGDIPLRWRLIKLVGAGAAVAWGACIAAVQLLPFLEWLPLSAEYRARTGTGFQLWSFEPETLLVLPLALIPNLYGNPTWEGVYWSFDPWGSFNESVLYAGAVPLALVIAALANWRSDPLVRCWVIIGGMTLGMALRLPVFDWVNQLPGFALGHPGRLRLIAIFSVALLAGRGLDEVLNPRWRSAARRYVETSLGLIAGAVGCVLLLTNVVFTRMDNWETRAVSRILNNFSDTPNPPRTANVCRERLETCGDELSRAFAFSNWEMYLALPVAVLALAALWTSVRSKRTSRLLAPVLLTLTAVELLAIGWGYNPAVSDAPLEQEPPALATAAEVAGEGRVTVLQQDALPDSHMLYEVQDIRGLDFKTKWYETYLSASGDRILWLANGVLLEGARPLVTALDVQAVLTTNPHLVARLTGDGSMRVATTSGDFTILAPEQPVPRATLRYDVRVVESDEAASRILAGESARALDTALLSDTEVARAAATAVTRGTGVWSATVTENEPQLLVIDVSTDQTGLLVVSDAYYPGWTAMVDGEPADILRTNIAFRGILIEPGNHIVAMRYEPASIRYGMLLSTISIFFAIAALALRYVRRMPALMRRLERRFGAG